MGDWADAVNTMRFVMGFLDPRSPKAMEQMKRIGDAAAAESRSNLQNEGHVITGQTLASIKVTEVQPTSVTIQGDEGSYWLEYGRGPVRPVRAKALHWIDPETGKDVFSQYSGPTEPTAFMERAVRTSVPKTIAEIDEEIQNELDSL